jgi:DNA mismatch repair protein MutS
MSEPALTPKMAQYQAMRKSLPADMILFYRLGDFYEMFFDDAKAASPIMNVALT